LSSGSIALQRLHLVEPMPEQPGLFAEQLLAVDDMIGHLVRWQIDQRLPADRAQ
jgi:hypothetical protein